MSRLAGGVQKNGPGKMPARVGEFGGVVTHMRCVWGYVRMGEVDYGDPAIDRLSFRVLRNQIAAMGKQTFLGNVKNADNSNNMSSLPISIRRMVNRGREHH